MSGLSRSAAARLTLPIASSSRQIATSAAVLAGGKVQGGKKKPVPIGGKVKIKAQGFTLKRGPKSQQASTGSSGGGGGSKQRVNLKYAGAGPAPDLSDLIRLHPEEFREDNIGRPVTFPKAVFEQLKTFGLPRKLDEEFTRGGPAATVLRRSTLDLANRLDAVKAGSSPASRLMLTGSAGSGKSTLLLQTLAYAISTDWIVLFLPRATTFLDSSAPYQFDAQSGTFHQPTLAMSALASLEAVNGAKLEGVSLVREVLGVQQGKSVREAVKKGARNEREAVRVLEVVMESLGKQDAVPVLFAVDEAQALFTVSTYRTPEFKPIEAYSLSMPLFALDYLSGRKSLARGMILAAPSATSPNVPLSPSLAFGLSLPNSHPITPYTALDPVHVQHASSGIEKVEVPFGMSGKEAAGMFELWGRKGWASKTTDDLYMGQFVASGGNPREFARGLARTQQVAYPQP